MLIGMILPPIEYQAKPVRGPGQAGELLIKSQGSAPNVKRLYSPPPGPSVTPQPGDRVYLDESGLPVIARTEAIWDSPWYGVPVLPSAFLQVQPTSQQKNQLMGLLTHSGLGAAGQKIGSLVINAYENQVSLANANAFLWDPFLQSPMRTMPQKSIAVVPFTMVSFTMAQGETIPVGRMAVETHKSAAGAQKQLENDIALIEQYNQTLSQLNDRVVPILEDISGLKIGPKPAEWRRWYINLVGYQLNQLQASETPTVIENVPLVYQPQPVPIGEFLSPIAAVSVQMMSCFGAGTLVRTLSGLEPIETLKVGDPVLTQSNKTGVLAYRPILVIHHNPPCKTFQVTLGQETVVSSEFHRFWKAGQGWVMARDLKAGDRIRTLDGPVTVTRIETGRVVPVYNLDVAVDADFFVGQQGVLVHDNTLPDLRELPFDAVAPSVEPARPARSG
jgi:hypothetical protein